MKKFLLFTLFIFSAGFVSAQNFINGSFENNNAINDTVFDYHQLAILVSNTRGLSGAFHLTTSADFCGNAIDGIWLLGGSSSQISVFTMELDSMLVAGNSYQVSALVRTCMNLGGITHLNVGISPNDSTIGVPVGIIDVPEEAWSLGSLQFNAPISGKYLAFTMGLVFGGFVQMDGTSISILSGVDNMGGNIFKISPNPFSSFTVFEFTLSSPSTISLEIFDMNGIKIASVLRDKTLNAGNHAVSFYPEAHLAGLYYYILRRNQTTEIGKIVLISN